MENTFLPQDLKFRTLNAEETAKAIEGKTPLYVDNFLAFYELDDDTILAAPVQLSEQGAVPPEQLDPETTFREDFQIQFAKEIDREILEAGFGTEDLRHMVLELRELLRARMLKGGSWTQREWDALERAWWLAG